jgi:hypothetical protein
LAIQLSISLATYFSHFIREVTPQPPLLRHGVPERLAIHMLVLIQLILRRSLKNIHPLHRLPVPLHHLNSDGDLADFAIQKNEHRPEHLKPALDLFRVKTEEIADIETDVRTGAEERFQAL